LFEASRSRHIESIYSQFTVGWIDLARQALE
jgi:hypothetical protein